MYTMGIDIGSASSKAVILKDGKDIIAYEAIQMGTGSSGPNTVLKNVLKKAEITMAKIDYIVATGYGRFSFNQKDKQISEISCHAKGVFYLISTARTIIDIGGQDAKAIKIDHKGNVRSFFMNDKCAAGTGRFLDVMARVLEITVEEMGIYDEKSMEPSQVSSTCTVFAESEVISLLSKGVEKENIIAGVHNSVSSKACSLAYRIGIEDEVVMSGGVALNVGVVRAISKELNRKVKVAANPQVVGALGAALYAFEECIKL